MQHRKWTLELLPLAMRPPPAYLEVLHGNRADMATLHGMQGSLKRRFGIQQATFVFFNGMSD